jgi:hypothetical protein
MEVHRILGDKVSLYRRPNSSRWQCSCSIKGRQYRSTTKEESLSAAKDVAEGWYLGLRNKDRLRLNLLPFLGSKALKDIMGCP